MKMRCIDIDDQQVSQEKFDTIVMNAATIEELSLINTNVSNFMLKTMVPKPWPKLISLNLSRNNLNNRSCKFLSACVFPNIEILWLANNKINDYGLIHLSKSNWQNIKQFSLSGNYLRQGSNTLAKFNFRKLKDLYLGYSGDHNVKIGEENRSALLLIPAQITMLLITNPQNNTIVDTSIYRKRFNEAYPKGKLFHM